MKIQEKIKVLMKQTNTTQVDIAKKLGVTQVNVSKKLNCKSIKVHDFISMVNTCGGTVEINIVLPDGNKI